MKKSSANLYAVFLEDKYSDLGLVGAMEVQGATLSLFSLSCRALGRGIEEQMLDFIREQKYSISEVNFQDTGKNGHMRQLFEETFVCQE